MKNLIQISLLLWLVSSAAAQETPLEPQNPFAAVQRRHPQEPQRLLHVYDWKGLAQQGELSGGELLSLNGTTVLKVENTNDTPQEVSLLKISDQSVIANMIENDVFFSCRVKYENVQGDGQLSVLCWLPHRAPFSDIPGGPKVEIGGMPGKTGDITGTSDWRDCLFGVKGIEGWGRLPGQLEMRLTLPGRGKVYLQPIKLMGMVPSWWSPEQAGLIGGIGGSLIGCLGGLVGVLASLGKARRFVLTMAKIFIALGISLLIAGAAASATKQPYAVYYPLLLMGFILTLVFSINLPSIQRRYNELEIRRMTSIDTGS